MFNVQYPMFKENSLNNIELPIFNVQCRRQTQKVLNFKIEHLKFDIEYY